MTRLLLSPGSADALLFDLGRVVLDIDFGKVMANWAGHAGCEPAELAARFSSRDEIFRRHETG
jgi:putative hydrolase of the HAD superfamily